PRLCGLGCLARALFPALCYTFCYAESGLRGSVEVNRSKELAKKKGLSVDMAEKEGFEPPIPLRVCRISSAVLSTTQPLLQAASNVRKRKAIVVEIASRCRFARERPSRRGLLYSQL